MEKSFIEATQRHFDEVKQKYANEEEVTREELEDFLLKKSKVCVLKDKAFIELHKSFLENSYGIID